MAASKRVPYFLGMKAGSVVAFALPIATMTGCLLTTSFDGIVGTKTGTTPGQDAADEQNSNVDGAKPFEGGDLDSGMLADSSSFCSLQTHTFCSDFDRDPLVQAGWSVVSNVPTVSRDTTNFVSAPAAARFDSPTDCTILEKFPLGGTGTKKLHFATDMQIVVSGVGYVTTSSFGLGTAGNEFLIVGQDRTLYYTQNQKQPDGGLAFQSTAVGQLPALKWAHVSLDLTVGNPSNVVIKVDGVVTWSSVTNPIVTDSPVELQIGDCHFNSNGGTILFDNVTLDLEY